MNINDKKLMLHSKKKRVPPSGPIEKPCERSTSEATKNQFQPSCSPGGRSLDPQRPPDSSRLDPGPNRFGPSSAVTYPS